MRGFAKINAMNINNLQTSSKRMDLQPVGSLIVATRIFLAFAGLLLLAVYFLIVYVFYQSIFQN